MKTGLVYRGALGLIITLLPVLARADAGGWYGALTLGRSRYDIATNVPTGSLHLSGGITIQNSTSNGSGSHTYAIGYKFNRYLSVEGASVDLGSSSISSVTYMPACCGITGFFPPLATNLDYSVTGHALDAVGSLPLSDSLSLFARAGIFRYDVQSTHVCPNCLFAFPAPPAQSNATGTTQDYGAGFSFTLNERFSARLGYTLFHNVGDPRITQQTNVHLNYLQLLIDF